MKTLRTYSFITRVSLSPEQKTDARKTLNMAYMNTDSMPTNVEVPHKLLEAHTTLNKAQDIEVTVELQKDGTFKVIGAKECG